VERNGSFAFLLFSILGLFIPISGVQVWITYYLTEKVTDFTMESYIYFGVTSFLAPLLGILFGRFILEKVGGYAEP